MHDIVVSTHIGDHHRINYHNGRYDPLQYPLLFPYGDAGWHLGIQRMGRISRTFAVRAAESSRT